MVYGLKSCKYGDIHSWLETEQKEGRFKDVFDFFVGINQQIHKTTENRKISKIKDYESPVVKCACKNALVNMVIENFKRDKLGLPIIPVIYVVEKDDTKLDVTKILERTPKMDCYGSDINITDAEIRRAFRLCSDPSLHEGIRRIAQKTFIFLALTTNKEEDAVKYNFMIKPAPWDSPIWQNQWKNRGHSEKLPKKRLAPPWREQVKTLMSESGSGTPTPTTNI